MSKQIDYGQPLSAEEKEWAQQFPGLHGGMVQANLEAFPPDTPAEEDVPPYTEWTVKELAAEAKRRNEQEGTSLPTTGAKDVLVKALEEDDAARA
jgi:hypothetical protein